MLKAGEFYQFSQKVAFDPSQPIWPQASKMMRSRGWNQVGSAGTIAGAGAIAGAGIEAASQLGKAHNTLRAAETEEGVAKDRAQRMTTWEAQSKRDPQGFANWHSGQEPLRTPPDWGSLYKNMSLNQYKALGGPMDGSHPTKGLYTPSN